MVEADFPFLGACYGIGTLGTLARRRWSTGRTASRSARSPITLTDDGRADPLLGVLPPTFDAFLGHKEAVSPAAATARSCWPSSATCPVQAFRLGSNVYATQFHPELDVDGLVHCGSRPTATSATSSPHGGRRADAAMARAAVVDRAAADPGRVRRSCYAR